MLMASIILMAFSNCSSSQKLQKNTPFVIGNCTSQKWVSGVEQGSAGTKVSFNVSAFNQERFQLDSLYFRGRKTKINTEDTSGGMQCTAKFLKQSIKKPDVVMHSDPKKEYGNTLPIKLERIPFELKENEAVVKYMENGKVKYYKIEGIKELPELYYPSAKPKKEY